MQESIRSWVAGKRPAVLLLNRIGPPGTDNLDVVVGGERDAGPGLSRRHAIRSDLIHENTFVVDERVGMIAHAKLCDSPVLSGTGHDALPDGQLLTDVQMVLPSCSVSLSG